ncbi:Kinesin light chain [Durusdinium trenchii]|uniref:Kinesin light chain n=1 Tax=Durusdinium trenchii TaxID=1381693 RepID=A0ABP0K9P1_9DINO
MEGTNPTDGSEAFVTYGRGLLKIFNGPKNFGFISPVFKGEDTEGPPLPSSVDEGIWFFGNHSLPFRVALGIELTFEIWENSQGKAQARSVQVTSEPSAIVPVEQKQDPAIGFMTEIQQALPSRHHHQKQNLHPNEPRVIYPSVYVSDVPVEWNEAAIRKLHRQLGLNPDTIMGLKFLPFTEVSLGLAGTKGEKQATPVTGSVILRYLNEEAANAAVERLKGHPIQTSSGVTKHLGAKHATPPKWVVQRKQQEDEGESQKVSGYVHRVSMAGYGVIKSPEWGEILWRQFELPTNLRCLQFTDRAKFVDMVGKQVDAELYKLPDGQLRASHVRALRPVLENAADDEMPQLEGQDEEPPSFPPVPGMPPFPGMPFMDPSFAMMGMPPPWAMGFLAYWNRAKQPETGKRGM